MPHLAVTWHRRSDASAPNCELQVLVGSARGCCPRPGTCRTFPGTCVRSIPADNRARAGDMRRAFRPAFRIESPFDAILGQPVLEHGAAVVEDDGVGLALRRTQYTTDHLAVEAH